MLKQSFLPIGLFGVFISTFIICGCAQHQIGYEIKKSSDYIVYKDIIALDEFSDERINEERRGETDEFLAFSSKDKHFTKPVNQAITEKLKEELTAAGIKVISGDTLEADYKLTGKVTHFQTVVKLPKTTVVPYLGTISSLWNSDEFITAVNINAQLIRLKDNQIIFDKDFVISEDLKLKTGPLNLSRLGRGLNYKLTLLDLALEDVLGQMKDEVIVVLKTEERG